jgi:hypothetical protein
MDQLVQVDLKVSLDRRVLVVDREKLDLKVE